MLFASQFLPRGREYMKHLIVSPMNGIRQGGTDVPVRIRRVVVQVDVRDAAHRAVVRVAPAKRHTSRFIYPGLQLLRGKYPPLAHFIRNSPSHESGLQDRAAPKFQAAYDASATKLTDETPHSEPLLEEPPRKGTRVPLLLNHNPSQ